MAVAAVGACDPCRQPLARNLGDRPRREVEHHRVRATQLGQVRDPPARLDRPPVRAKHRGERVADRLRSALRNRPAEGVAGVDQRATHRGAHRTVHRAEGMGRDPAEERPRLRRPPGAGEQRRRQRPPPARSAPAATGWRGTCSTGFMMSSSSSPKCAEGEPKTRRQAAPSSPSPSAVSSIERTITPTLPSSSGCARSTSGHSHSSPCRSRSSDRRNGDPTAIGWVAEQSSWSSPGTVSSLVRVPPPMRVLGLEHRHLARRCARARQRRRARWAPSRRRSLRSTTRRVSRAPSPRPAGPSRRCAALDHHREIEGLIEPRLAGHHVLDRDRPLLEQPVDGVPDLVVLIAAPAHGRLGLQIDQPHVSRANPQRS